MRCVLALAVLYLFVFNKSCGRIDDITSFSTNGTCSEHLWYEVRINLHTKSQDIIGDYISSLNASLPTYHGKCRFLTENAGYEAIAFSDDPYRFFFILNGENLCGILRYFTKNYKEKIKNAIFGPYPVPMDWMRFPQNNCIEKNFTNTIYRMGSYAVHSTRVRDHLVTRANITNYEPHKFAIVRPCTLVAPTTIKPWKDREIDVILFEKYADIDRKQQGLQIYEMLKAANLKVVRVGVNQDRNTSPESIRQSHYDAASNAKFIIYFSFWDTSALRFHEMQNHGVYSFTVQDDLVDAEGRVGIYVPELAGDDVSEAMNSIIRKMKEISASNPDSEKIARINQERLHCHRALDDLCKHVMTMPAWQKTVNV